MPLKQIFGRYVFVVAVCVRTFPLCPMKFNLRPPSSFALARLVDTDDEFMVACDRGDLLTVRSMLQDGRGRPTDVTDKNGTPLTVSDADKRDAVQYASPQSADGKAVRHPQWKRRRCE